MNSGGRVSFEKGSKVRLLELDGRVSKKVYTMHTNKTDRKGHILVTCEAGEPFKVNHRRILPEETTNKACVVEYNDKYRVICPACGIVDSLKSLVDKYTCQCGSTNECHWIGIQTITPEEEVIMVKKESEAKLLDLDSIKNLPNVELYSKKAQFDHERIDVKSYTVVYNGDNPRKFSFNTYNGTLGKNATELPINDFITGAENPKFSKIQDYHKAVDKLLKAGYEKVT